MSDSPEQHLLRYLKGADYRPIPQRELLHRMQVGPEDRPMVRRLIERMIQDGTIHKIAGGRLVVGPSDGEMQGVMQRHREGFGFVVPDGGGEDLFVPPRHTGEALTGDRVAARITGRRRDGRLYGVVTTVLESRKREFLGLFSKRGAGGTVQPFDPSMGDAVHVAAPFCGGASDLDAVRIALVKGRGPGRPLSGKVIEVLGPIDEPGTDTEVVAGKYGLALGFPEPVLEAAAELPDHVGELESEGRERFDDPSPVTIDGETARDFDDAIAVSELSGGGFRLFVHIADVSHFVPAGGTLDLEAGRRGCSVYFPNRVLPMFPEELSDGLCSLRPGEDRLVQSAVLDFSSRGEVKSVRFADGVMRSAARLTYTQVASLLDDTASDHGIPSGLHGMLRSAERLRAILERRRHRRGSIDFDLPEPQILLDVEGVMTGIVIAPRNRAHLMIEEFMLAANDAVAEHLDKHRADCLYRVHEPPDPSKLDALVQFVESLGQRLETRDGKVTPGDIQRMLERVEDRPESRVVSQVALRTMMQARYSPNNTGHFGLASPTYCHFTSPIRRYPDLIVHRQLRACRQRPPRRKIMEPGALGAVAETSSELERNAEAAERELLLWKKNAYIAGKVGETFDGLVTGVTRFGLFVQLTENLAEGLVRVEWLGDEWFEHNERRFELRGSRSGKAYRLGDRLRVRVDRVDRVLQRVDLSLAGSEPKKAARQAPTATAGGRARGRGKRRGDKSRARGASKR